MAEAKDLKRTTVKCHGMFNPKLAINGVDNGRPAEWEMK